MRLRLPAAAAQQRMPAPDTHSPHDTLCPCAAPSHPVDHRLPSSPGRHPRRSRCCHGGHRGRRCGWQRWRTPAARSLCGGGRHQQGRCGSCGCPACGAAPVPQRRWMAPSLLGMLPCRACRSWDQKFSLDPSQLLRPLPHICLPARWAWDRHGPGLRFSCVRVGAGLLTTPHALPSFHCAGRMGSGAFAAAAAAAAAAGSEDDDMPSAVPKAG